MEFLVHERNRRPPVAAKQQPFVVLIRDNWDDSGLKTSFFVELHTEDRRTLQVGTVKILKLGQTSGPTPLPTYSEDGLDHTYCSLGQSLSYYEALKALGRRVYIPLLVGLRDIVYRPSIREIFADEVGLSRSIELSGSSVRVLEDTAGMFHEPNSQMPHPEGQPLSLTFHTSVGGSTFDLPLIFHDSRHLPTRVNAIIGYNGTGKTRLLANLAMVAHADPVRRSNGTFVERYGEFLGHQSEAFGSVVAVSYSAFDTFEVPGRTEEDREHLQRSGAVRGYSYCGLRSFASDREPAGTEPHRLKGIGEVADEFFRTLGRLRDEPGRSLLEEAMGPISEEPSFQRLELGSEVLQRSDFAGSIFPFLSTGHKIVLNIVAQLALNLQRRSMVLMDEPESHLHPPLLAALLRSVGLLLDRRDSFAVVATHAPVVIQEIPRRYVRVLRRFGQITEVHEPEIETFGENVGLLTRHVFSLDSSATDYQGVLRRLASEFSLEEIDTLFGDGLSSQARSYVASLLRSRS